MSMKKYFHRSLIALSIASLLVGCVTTSDLPEPHARSEAPDAPDLLLSDLGVGDARFQRVEGFEHILVDPSLHWRIEDYHDQKGLLEKKAFIRRFIQDANTMNNHVMASVLDKISADKHEHYLTMLLKEHPELLAAAKGNSPRERLYQAYERHSVDELQEEIKGFEQLDNEEKVDRYWQFLVDHIEDSIKSKGRVERLLVTAPLVPVIYSWIWYHAATDDRNAHVPTFAQTKNFLPPAVVLANGKKNNHLVDPWDLVQTYAPVIYQEIPQQPHYTAFADYFGEVALSGKTVEDASPFIHTDRPTVYAYAQRKKMQGVEVWQLVYTLWYPEHPAMKSFDPEAGILEGWTFRITLNTANQPVMYESVSNCGCYYKVFPSARMEEESAKTYTSLEEGKRFSLEKNVPGRIDAVVPETVPMAQNASDDRVTLYYSAGHHQLVSVRAKSNLAPLPSPLATQNYRLAHYEELESLPLQNVAASLFAADGLVRKADRPECFMLTPSGLYHAGHPRQRGTQMIYFDQADFDDPQLFEKYLRLPPKAFVRGRY